MGGHRCSAFQLSVKAITVKSTYVLNNGAGREVDAVTSHLSKHMWYLKTHTGEAFYDDDRLYLQQ